jgi:hypothetical protein
MKGNAMYKIYRASVDFVVMAVSWGAFAFFCRDWFKLQNIYIQSFIILMGPATMGIYLIRLYLITRPRKVK